MCCAGGGVGDFQFSVVAFNFLFSFFLSLIS